jgi:D-psicose/D-tagatose/L-ribulose 3-epimerase
MNKLGLHMLVYTPAWTEPGARKVFEKAAKFGYDFVEVIIFDPHTVDVDMTVRLSREYGLGVATSLCGTLTSDLSNPDPVIAKRGEEWVIKAISVTRDMGATMLGGPSFSAVHRYALPPSEFARDNAVKAYQRLAKKAKAAGVRIGLEALNRYESNFINTLDQAATFCKRVGSDALFVHGDMFHMNIEEGDIGNSIESVKDLLGYVHIAESHRGYLGTGNTDWKKLFGALAKIGYQGPITFEAFSPAVLGFDFAGFIALWRDPFTDPDDIAQKSLAFMRKHINEANKPKAPKKK